MTQIGLYGQWVLISLINRCHPLNLVPLQAIFNSKGIIELGEILFHSPYFRHIHKNSLIKQ